MSEGAHGVQFRGTRGPTASSSALVLVEDPSTGDVLGALEHRVRYSPTGFNWGYDGAGPRDLARSLLAAVLAEDALCNLCRGETAGCSSCRDGLRLDLPDAAFTSEVVARLPPDWLLYSHQVLAWWDRYRADRELGESNPTANTPKGGQP